MAASDGETLGVGTLCAVSGVVSGGWQVAQMPDNPSRRGAGRFGIWFLRIGTSMTTGRRTVYRRKHGVSKSPPRRREAFGGRWGAPGFTFEPPTVGLTWPVSNGSGFLNWTFINFASSSGWNKVLAGNEQPLMGIYFLSKPIRAPLGLRPHAQVTSF